MNNNTPIPKKKTFAEIAKEKKWGQNNKNLSPALDKDKYLAGSTGGGVSLEDISLLQQIFANRQRALR
jgi:hypothetical protein